MNIVTQQIRKLVDRWFTPDEARAITYEQQLKNWNIEEWTFSLTKSGKEYSSLSSKDRDLIRKDKYKNV